MPTVRCYLATALSAITIFWGGDIRAFYRCDTTLHAEGLTFCSSSRREEGPVACPNAHSPLRALATPIPTTDFLCLLQNTGIRWAFPGRLLFFTYTILTAPLLLPILLVLFFYLTKRVNNNIIARRHCVTKGRTKKSRLRRCCGYCCASLLFILLKEERAVPPYTPILTQENGSKSIALRWMWV